MADAIGQFLIEAAVVSLSGVMAPGPVSAATLSSGLRRPHAGAGIAVGHGIVELPLVALVLVGAGALFESAAFRAVVGLVGGAALLVMAGLMVLGLRRRRAGAPSPRTGGPIRIGIVLTAGNPYFLLWWATVGLALSTRAAELGVLAFALFAAVHWACDLVWLEVLSLASNKGLGIFGPKVQRVVTALCAAAMAVFGVLFLLDAIGGL